MRYPNILTARWFTTKAAEVQCRVPPGMSWVPARPTGYPSHWHRCKAAWLVFTGKADAVTWEGGQ